MASTHHPSQIRNSNSPSVINLSSNKAPITSTKPRFRSRTGCWTCRRRKVKCDERGRNPETVAYGGPLSTNAGCKRCQDSGRPCHGYGPQAPNGPLIIPYSSSSSSSSNNNNNNNNLSGSPLENFSNPSFYSFPNPIQDNQNLSSSFPNLLTSNLNHHHQPLHPNLHLQNLHQPSHPIQNSLQFTRSFDSPFSDHHLLQNHSSTQNQNQSQNHHSNQNPQTTINSNLLDLKLSSSNTLIPNQSQSQNLHIPSVDLRRYSVPNVPTWKNLSSSSKIDQLDSNNLISNSFLSNHHLNLDENFNSNQISSSLSSSSKSSSSKSSSSSSSDENQKNLLNSHQLSNHTLLNDHNLISNFKPENFSSSPSNHHLTQNYHHHLNHHHLNHPQTSSSSSLSISLDFDRPHTSSGITLQSDSNHIKSFQNSLNNPLEINFNSNNHHLHSTPKFIPNHSNLINSNLDSESNSFILGSSSSLNSISDLIPNHFDQALNSSSFILENFNDHQLDPQIPKNFQNPITNDLNTNFPITPNHITFDINHHQKSPQNLHPSIQKSFHPHPLPSLIHNHHNLHHLNHPNHLINHSIINSNHSLNLINLPTSTLPSTLPPQSQSSITENHPFQSFILNNNLHHNITSNLFSHPFLSSYQTNPIQSIEKTPNRKRSSCSSTSSISTHDHSSSPITSISQRPQSNSTNNWNQKPLLSSIETHPYDFHPIVHHSSGNHLENEILDDSPISTSHSNLSGPTETGQLDL